MSFIITNLFDGTSQTVGDGEEARVIFPGDRTSGGARALIVTQAGDPIVLTLAQGGDYNTAIALTWAFMGGLDVTLTPAFAVLTASPPGASLVPGCEIVFLANGIASPLGRYFCAMRYRDPITLAIVTFRLTIELAEPAMFAVRPSWLPAGLIDLHFDLDRGDVRSMELSRRIGYVPLTDGTVRMPGVLAAGAEAAFAVLPELGGVAVAADVTEIELSFRANNQFEDPAILSLAGTGSDLETVGSDHYYALQGDLASPGLREAFEELDPPDPGTPNAVRALRCLAQLRVKHDGTNYVSDLFEVVLQRPCDEALLA